MRGKFSIATVALCFALALTAASYAQAQEDIEKHPSCKYCGMDRQAFAHSRFLIVYDDGTEVATCSLHCAAIDNVQNLDAAPTALRVGDHDTKNLIDAESAFWVIGGKQPGVMTKRPKWAFEKKDAAERFIAANGGDITTFEESMRATYEDMYADTRMIRERRQMKRMQSLEQEQQKDRKHQ